MSWTKDTLPLEKYTTTKLTHTYRKPAEWIGQLDDDRHIYMVAKPRSITVAISANLFDALQTVKQGDGQTIKHGGFSSELTTEQMLEATGLQVQGSVKENCAGEVR